MCYSWRESRIFALKSQPLREQPRPQLLETNEIQTRQSGPLTNILIYIFKVIPVSSERRCGPGPSIPVCIKDLFWKGGAKRVKVCLSSVSPHFKLKKKKISLDLRLGTKPSHQARETVRKVHNLWMWLETGKSVLKEARQINWKQNHGFGGLHFSVATYAIVAVLSSGCYMVVKGCLKEFKGNVLWHRKI